MEEEQKKKARAERYVILVVMLKAISIKSDFSVNCYQNMMTIFNFFSFFFRFGLSTNATVDEEAKKKARIERFSPGLKVDASEEEKKKARALRSFFNLLLYLPPKPLVTCRYLCISGTEFSGLLRILLVHHSQVPTIALIL